MGEQRRIEFEENLTLQRFVLAIDHLDVWIQNQRTNLQPANDGDSLETVEFFLKRHDEFEKSLVVQNTRIQAVLQEADILLQAGHSQQLLIRQQSDRLKNSVQGLRLLADQRQHRLYASLQLQQFLRDSEEVLLWIGENILLAQDQCYQNLSSLPAKIQHHLSFEGELQANEKRLAVVELTGRNLLHTEHYAKECIAAHLQQQQSRWAQLRSLAKDKGAKLNQALSLAKFQQQVEILNTWFNDSELLLQNSDLGDNLSATMALLKRHHLLEAVIFDHQKRVEDITVQAQQLVAANHFKSTVINGLAMALKERCAALNQPVNQRRQCLTDAVLLQQFYRDVAEEMAWIVEKLPLLSIVDLGCDEHATQKLLLKQAVVQAAITTQGKVVSELGLRAVAMQALEQLSG